MVIRVDSARLKIIRAEQHLNAIAEAFRPYRYGDLHVVTKYDRDSRWRIVTIHPPHPGLEPSVIIGDCLHNMRSALDHLVWQLVLANKATPDKRNMFPISNTQSDFTEQIRRQRVRGVSEQALALIDRLQPYHGGNPHCDLHPLWILSELTNIDKHRTLNLTTVVTDTVDLHGGGVHVSVVCAGMADGAVILRDRPEPSSDNMDMSAQGGMFVTFQDAPARNRDVLMVMQEILQFIRQTVLPGFEPFFI